jgi:hypothetical protein
MMNIGNTTSAARAEEFGKANVGSPANDHTQHYKFGNAVLHACPRSQPPARRVYDPGLSVIPQPMAWRPYENLIDGELSNRTPGKVTGWMRFYQNGRKPLKALFDLAGDFHEDIRGRTIRLRNPNPQDRNDALDRRGTYMEGFSPAQRGAVGDITAGLPLGPWTEELASRLKTQLEIVWKENGLSGQELQERRLDIDRQYRAKIAAGESYHPYVSYPYIEWYSDANGRVVLELDPSQVEVDSAEAGPTKEKRAAELVRDEKKRSQALRAFMAGMLRRAAKKRRRKGGGKVTGMVVG